jgi:hypothetical protein
MDVIISLDDFYSGSTTRIPYNEEKGIYADFAEGSSRIIRFIFLSCGGWDRETAARWLRKRGLNKIYFRKESNGNIYLNHVSLSAPVSQIECSDDKTTVEKVFGKEAYAKIMEIENRHNSDKPLVVKVVAMDFKGKDFVIGNGIKFYRDQVQKMVKSFSGLGIRLGHPNLFESYSKRIGNTVGSYVDDDGNPVTYSYINPHSEAGDFREDLRIAEAQGQLESFEVSMFGNPIDYETVKDEDVEKEDGARVLMHKWEPTGQDFVDEGAVSGSRAVQIANAVIPEDTKTDQLGGSKVTIAEILKALSEHDGLIALSDFLSVKAFRKAFDEHVEVKLTEARRTSLSDLEFIKEVINTCPDEVLTESDRISKIVNDKVAKKRKQMADKVEDIAKIAEANKIELNENQMFMVKNNISGEETEEEILGFIKAAKMFDQPSLGVTAGLFSSPEDKSGDVKLSKKRESFGASMEIVEASERKIEI